MRVQVTKSHWNTRTSCFKTLHHQQEVSDELRVVSFCAYSWNVYDLSRMLEFSDNCPKHSHFGFSVCVCVCACVSE